MLLIIFVLIISISNDGGVIGEVRTWAVNLQPIRNEMRGTVYSAIERSVKIWNGLSCVHLVAIETFANANIQIEFFKSIHNDKYPFDNIGGILGHTFYPTLLNNQMWRSHVHLDLDDINRLFSNDIELTDLILFDRVIAHEIGHSLGLQHNENKNCIMSPSALANPSYYYVACLSDILALQYIYGECKWNHYSTLLQLNMMYLNDGMLYRFREYPQHVLHLREIIDAKQLVFNLDYENATQLYENSRYIYIFYDNRMCAVVKKNIHRTWCYYYDEWMPHTTMHIRGIVKFHQNRTTTNIFLVTQTHVYALMENKISKIINPHAFSMFRLSDWLLLHKEEEEELFRCIFSGHYLYTILSNGRYNVYKWFPGTKTFTHQHGGTMI